MKLAFESNLNYQQEAIQAVANLFEGQAQEESDYQFCLKEQQSSLIAGIGNRLILSEEQILANLQKYRNKMTSRVPIRLKTCIFRLKWKQVQAKHTFICVQSMN